MARPALLCCFCLSILVGFSFCQAVDGDHLSPRDESLFQQFEAESFENVEKFKSDIVRLLKRQNLYLNSIQSKIRSMNIQDEFKFVIETPFEQVQFPNQLQVSYPLPNVERLPQINTSQTVVSISEDHSLNLWTITGGQRLNFVDSYPLRIHPDDYTCVKVLSFVQNNVPTGWINYRRADFRLVIVTLWRWNRQSDVGDVGRILITDDMITVHVFNGYLSPHGYISSLKPLKMSPNSIQAEQSIKLDVIADFDVISVRENDGSQYWFLSVIQSNDESNAKFQLDLFKLKESKFDRIASLQTNEMINAHRVKLAMFNSQLYLICTYDRSVQDLKYYPIISIYKHIETFEESSLRHECSLRNESQISRIESIHHLPDKDLIFMRQQESIIVYWFNGNTFVFFTEIKPNFGDSNQVPDDRSFESITSFALSEMPNSKPFLATAYDNRLVVHYQIYDSFHSSLIRLKSIPAGYVLRQMRAFYWNMDYYLALSFEAISNGYSGSPNLLHFTQIRRVVLKTPESNDDIRTYEFCEMDLKKRLENGIQHVMKLDRTSEQLLVISPEKPEVDVDVIVEETLITEQELPEVRLSVEAKPYHIGSEVKAYARHVKDRLVSRQQFIENNVALLDRSQTLTCPVIFTKPIKTQYLHMLRADGVFMLNSVPFDVYRNNSLTVNDEQSIMYSSPITFSNGLKVDNLYVRHVNGVSMKSTIDIKSRDSVRMADAQHRYDSVVLSNGTTAARLNNVNLAHVFQDRPSDYSGQYFRGRKHFDSVTTEQINVDSTVNGFGLQEFFDNLIWLNNANMKSQSLNGSLLHFMAPVIANQSHIDGSINGILVPERLALDALRTNVPSSIFGSVILENGASSKANVIFKGLLNGQIDLMNDVILLNRDQDFTRHSNAKIRFESVANVNADLRFEIMNGRVESGDILTRGDLSKHQEMLANGILAKPLLYNKHFTRDLFVDGNVDLHNYVTINGYDLSEMFKQLDTVSSFNTPLFVDNLVVRGNLKSMQYNNIPIEDLKQLLWSRLRKLAPQTILGPFNYLNGEVSVKSLRFNFTKSGLRFPQDFVKKDQNGSVSQPVNFYAPKYFQAPTQLNDLSSQQPAGLINGLRISEFFSSLVGNSSEKSQVIHGRKRFQNLYINGDLQIETGIVNENFLDKLLLLDANRNISNRLAFEDVSVLSRNVLLERLILNGWLNGEVADHWLDDLVHLERGSSVEMRNKHFPSLVLENLHTSSSHPIMGVDIGAVVKGAILVDHEASVASSLIFSNVMFEDVRSFKTINGLPPSYFGSAVLKSSSPIKIYGKKTFDRDIYATALHSKSSSVNAVNLTDLMDNSVLRTANQIFSARPLFLNRIGFKNLNLDERLYVGEYRLKNYVKLNQKTIEIVSPVVFERLSVINGDLFVSGTLNTHNLSGIARQSVPINPDGSFSLLVEYVPFLHISNNLRLPAVLNGEKNELKNVVHVGNEMPLLNSVVFGDTVLVKNLFVSSLVNGVNVTFLLNDAVYEHLPQAISGRKQFVRPVKIIGDLRQANNEPFRVKQVSILSGMLNEVNLTRLFHSTVSTEDSFEVFGEKQFSGKIRFHNLIHSPNGLNGARVPEDLYLTFTNETIFGEVNFYKPLHINHDLNVRLINRVNLTQFTDNVVFIEPLKSADELPVQILSVLNFQDSVHVKNLTIVQEINDIEIEELLPSSRQGIVIGGLKKFHDKLEPIQVHGNLNVVTVNKLNFDKDLKNDWIDTRHDVPVQIDGTLRLKQPTSMRRLNIKAKLNNFKVDQISGEFFQMLDQQIQRLNQSIGNEMNHFNRIGRNLENNVYTEFLFEIRFFIQVQLFEKPVIELYSSAYNLQPQQQYSDLVLIEENLFKPNKTHECFKYHSRFYVASTPTRFVPNDLSTFGGHALATFNMKALFVPMLNSAREKFAIQSTFGSDSVCRNILHKSGLRVSHHLSFYEQRFSPELLLNLGYFNETLLQIAKVRAFSTEQNIKILLVLFRDEHGSTTKFEIFRVDFLKKLIEPIQEFPNAHIIDFDLSVFEGRFFLSLVYGRVRGQSSSTTIMQWNNRLFGLLHTKIDQFLYGSEYRYQTTAFLETPYGLFLAFSTVGSAAQLTECSSFGTPEENYIDVWRWNDGKIEHYQRLSLENGRGNGAEMALASFSRMVYLFAPTGRDSVAVFRHQGASRFQLWQTLTVPELSSLRVFWHNKSLYVSLGSKRHHQSRLLKALISGASQSMQFLQESTFDSITQSGAHHSTRAKLAFI